VQNIDNHGRFTGMTITNQQVKLLMKNLKKYTQEIAAAKAGMDVKTARKYINSEALPSDMEAPHVWKTRTDIFALHWDEIEKMLKASPRLQGKTLIAYLIKKYPDYYHQKHLRTLQRRIRDWRAEKGSLQPVIFRQDIKPGKQSQSDYTCMNSLNITINSQTFKHLLFHFILPYSRWESVSLCFSESFDTLVCGYEKAVWELGYVAKEHRTDNLTAATQAMGSRREFTERWQQFMAHYAVTPTTNNPGVSHENGSVEKSHDTLKNAIEQELMLRGSTDFLTQQDYMTFVSSIVAGRNKQRQERLLTEMDFLVELPDKKWHSPIIIRARVSSGSVIQILDAPYTVPSRLIHYTLKAYVYPDEIVLFYGNKKLQTMPRAHVKTLAGINYRHIIDSLIRKPAAFSNYQYYEALFPRLCFRKAYDALRDAAPANADKQYLKLLQLAKLHSEQEVAEALELLLEEHQIPTPDVVRSLIDVYAKERLQVYIHQPNVAEYDSLLSSVYGKETH
jgi:transposase